MSAKHTEATGRRPASQEQTLIAMMQFKQAYVFTLTALRLPHNLAKTSTYRDLSGRGQHLPASQEQTLIAMMQFKQAYVFTLTALRLPHNLAKTSTYRDLSGRGQHLP